MKTLKFRHELVKEILEGKKTSTWRLFDDKDLQAGDDLELVNKQTGEVFAQAKITKAREKKLRELDEKDFEGYAKYESVEDTLHRFQKYYGDKVTTETVVKMISFRVLRP